MEYSDFGDLSSLILRYKKVQRIMPEIDCWKLIFQISRGLHVLHKNGIMHRDLKSPNILMFKSGILKIGDMNIAKKLRPSKSGTENALASTQAGTPYYSW